MASERFCIEIEEKNMFEKVVRSLNLEKEEQQFPSKEVSSVSVCRRKLEDETIYSSFDLETKG